MEQIINYLQPQEQCTVIKPTIKKLLLAIYSFIPTFFFSFFFLGILFIFIFPIIFPIVYFLKKATLKNTEYKFYSNRIEYYEGFLVKNRKTISYDKISNVGQTRGILERLFGLGTIYLDTPGSSRVGHELAISYLENYDQLYDWICQTTQQQNKNGK